MTIKYAVYPGWIISKSDGDEHWINADVLMDLYKVTPSECIVIDAREIARLPETYRYYFDNELIGLYPQYGGNYELPEFRSSE